MFDLTVREGLTATAAKNFVDCGIIAGGILGDYDTAYRLGKSAFEVIDRFEARAIASSVNFVFATYVSSWRAPCPEAMAAFEEAYRVGIETGDIQHVGFSLALKLHRLLHTGHELADCQKQLEETIPFLEKSQLSSPRTAIVLVERALARLCYSDATEAQIEQDDQLAEQLVLATKNP